MRLSNHQKHGFHPVSKEFRRDKNWVKATTYWGKVVRHARWNGDPFPLTGEVGRIEQIRWVEM